MNKKAVIILSGGLDSTTLAYFLVNQGYDLEAISFDYGQKHVKELECAKITCNKLKINHTIIPMSWFGILVNSTLTQADRAVPEGHYADENMRRTVVPHRNTIMATIANAIGISKDITTLALGVHAGDHFIYPDCRPVFIKCLEELFTLSADQKIEILAPFQNTDKTGILRKGLELEVPYEDTWTCYNGRESACGKCGSCNERLESFKLCGKMDPIHYEEQG